MRAAFIFILLGVLPGCFAVEPPDGAYQCATEGRACPAGYDCVSGFCVRPGAEPDLAVEIDMSVPPPDLARPIDAPDLAKPDFAVVPKPDLSVPSREVCVVAQASNEIVVHRSIGDGNVAPLRTISGVSTLLSSPTGIAADLANKEIFAANPGTHRVIVFAAAASADIAPLRYLDNIGTPMAVAVNPVDNELYVVNRATKRIEVYARAASGTPTPKRTLDLPFTSPTGLAYDHNNRELIVTDVAAPYAVGVWDSLATGTPQAKRTITGQLAQLSIPNAVAVDPKNGEIYVANTNGNSVTVFSHTATGNIAPARTLSGLATGLNRPSGVTLDISTSLLVVANNASGNLGSLAFFELASSGNRAPLRAITGAATELLGPFGVAYCSN